MNFSKYKQLKTVNKRFQFKTVCIALGFILLFGCGKEERKRNPYLLDVHVQYEINLSLPQYDALRFAGGSVRLLNVGLNGIIVFNLNGNTFLAWEATCPNHTLKACSILSVKGVLAECSCENYQYSLANGQLVNAPKAANKPYQMLFYNVSFHNNILNITN